MIVTLSKKLNRDLRSNSDVIIDLDERMESYHKGDMICKLDNFGGLGSPFALEFAIGIDGKVKFRKWYVSKPFSSGYAHLIDNFDPNQASDEQRKTVSDLITGRKKFRGVKIGIGQSIQHAVGGISKDLIGDTIMSNVNETWIPIH